MKLTKKIRTTAARLCQEELSASGAMVDILKLCALARLAEAGVSVHGGDDERTRAVIRAWLDVHRANPPTYRSQADLESHAEASIDEQIARAYAVEFD